MRTFRFLSDNLDETLFEHRNKEYGAYELRKSYHSRLNKSFFFSMSFIAFLFGTPLLIELLSNKPETKPETYTTLPLKLEQKFEVEQKQKEIDPPPPSTQRALTNTAFKILSDSLLSKETDKKDTTQKENNLTASTNSNTFSYSVSRGDSKDTTFSGGTPGGSGATLIASSAPLSMAAVDVTPKFPGGDPSLISYLQKNIRFNERAKEAGVSGKVCASFIINSKGEVEAIKIIKSLGYGLDEEVTRVVGMMPNWVPGSYKGKPVSTIMNLPVSFSLIQ